MNQLPDPIPPLPDPYLDGEISPYSISPLRDVCGTRIAFDSPYYKVRSAMTRPGFWLKSAVHPELEIWINQVSGFDPRSKIIQTPLPDLPMSAVIPRILGKGGGLPFSMDKGTYIVDYPSMNSAPDKPPEREWVPSFKQDSLPEGSQLLLSFFGSRKLTMGLWTIQGFWDHPFMKQFDGVMMPDFSCFADDPKPQSLFGERMMQIFAREGSDAGMNIIPTIAWAEESSMRRQVELWASQYPYVNTIHLDCYGAKVDRKGWIWRWLYAIEKYCKPHQHIRWLISGVTAGWAIRELNEIFPNRNFNLIMALSPYVNSMVGSTDPEFRARKFREKIRTLEDLHSGRVQAPKDPRPDEWPQWRDVRRS